MKSLAKLLFLMLTLVPLSKSKDSNTNEHKICDIQCSNDSTCPTWFFCNAKKNCQCDDEHRDNVLCNSRAHISAVLNCNCVTYNKDKNEYARRCIVLLLLMGGAWVVSCVSLTLEILRAASA